MSATLQFAAFCTKKFEADAVSAVSRFRNAHAIIVDVRGNGGGITPDDLLRALLDGPFRTLSESSTISVALSKAETAFISNTPDPLLDLAPPLAAGTLSWSNPPEEPSENSFKGRLIILIDGGCASACDDFVAPFKLSGRATLIGETTYGSTGQPFFENLPDGVWFPVSAKRDTFPDGTQFEGVGIPPNITVAPTLESLRAGSDPALAKAGEMALST